MVRCARYLQIIEEDGLVENAARVGAVFLKGLEKLRRVSGISNVRGRGLLLAFDFPNPTRKRYGWLLERGLAALPCGPARCASGRR